MTNHITWKNTEIAIKPKKLYNKELNEIPKKLINEVNVYIKSIAPSLV
jgi:hypothetical protein